MNDEQKIECDCGWSGTWDNTILIRDDFVSSAGILVSHTAICPSCGGTGFYEVTTERNTKEKT